MYLTVQSANKMLMDLSRFTVKGQSKEYYNMKGMSPMYQSMLRQLNNANIPANLLCGKRTNWLSLRYLNIVI